MFAVTRRKAGWDCMRHLEILANGAVPYFPDLESMPDLTMQHHPKHLYERAKKMDGVHYDGDILRPSSFFINTSVFSFDQYFALAEETLKYSREHLTTRAMAQYLLQTVGFSSTDDVSKILFATHCVDDYLQDATLHGLKLVLKTRLIDYVPNADRLTGCVVDRSKRDTILPNYRVNMYMDAWAALSLENFATRKGYGKGFTIWNRLSFSEYGQVDRTRIDDQLTSGAFDLVLLSDRCATSPEEKSFVDAVRKSIPSRKVVILFGGDEPVSAQTFAPFVDMADWFFAREIQR